MMLRIEYVSLADLKRHPRNPKDHDIGAISRSVNRFGFTAPVIVDERTGYLAAGHGRIDTLAQLKAQGQEPPANVQTDAAGDWLVPVVRGVSFNSDAEIEAYLVADNRLTVLGGWNEPELAALLQSLAEQDEALLEVTGFDGDDLQALLDELGGAFDDPAADSGAPAERASLSDRFIVPPFSVLDARAGYWQQRKRAWLAYGIRSEIGRGSNLTYEIDLNYGRTHRANAAPGGSLMPAARIEDGKIVRGDGKGRRIKGQEIAVPGGSALPLTREKNKKDEEAVRAMVRDARINGGTIHGSTPPHGPNVRQNADGTLEYTPSNGTSIFDPVVCELAYRWFCPPTGGVLDPFAGGSVRGIVASLLGRSYTGIDLSAPQIAANEEQAGEILRGDSPRPTWIVGDSRHLNALLPEGSFDLLFSCPPYFDLEIYSDDEADLSNAGDYAAFIAAYRDILRAAVGRLRDDRFAVLVVGDVRDKRGMYRNFVADTIAAMRDAGLALYNDAVLLTSIGSLSIRVGRQFSATRKLGKAHQNVLVFVKGDGRKATEACGDVEVEMPEEIEAEAADEV